MTRLLGSLLCAMGWHRPVFVCWIDPRTRLYACKRKGCMVGKFKND